MTSITIQPIDGDPSNEDLEQLARISEDDATWFAQRPGRNYRIRPSVAIEGGSPGLTVVRQARPGVRFRAPFVPTRPLTGTEKRSESFAEWVFTEVCSQWPGPGGRGTFAEYTDAIAASAAEAGK